MKNYKYGNIISNSYPSYIDRRKELRKRAKLSSPVWSSPSTSEDESNEDLYISFFKKNLYFDDELNK